MLLSAMSRCARRKVTALRGGGDNAIDSPGNAETPVPGEAEPPTSKKRAADAPPPSSLPERPWAVLSLDVETHGWLEPLPDACKKHRGQFGKLRSNGVLRNLDYARVVQLGWCAFAANGDVLHRQELCVCDAPPCQQKAIDYHGLTDVALCQRGESLAEVLMQFTIALTRLQRDGGVLVAHLMENDAG